MVDILIQRCFWKVSNYIVLPQDVCFLLSDLIHVGRFVAKICVGRIISQKFKSALLNEHCFYISLI